MNDFVPCRCGEQLEIYIHRVPAPDRLSGYLYTVCCNRCGQAAPFVSFAPLDSITLEAIAAWNKAATDTDHARIVAELTQRAEAAEAENKVLEQHLVNAMATVAEGDAKLAAAEACVESMTATAETETCVRHECRRIRTEMQAEIDGLRAKLAAVEAAPVVVVRQVGATFGHGDFGSYWTIGSSYEPPPDWIRDKQRVRIVPAPSTGEEG